MNRVPDARVKSVADVAAWRLCVGCGACAGACPEGHVQLIDVSNEGIRPRVAEYGCVRCGSCVQVCPGYTTEHPRGADSREPGAAAGEDFGPVLEIWEGYARDEEIRYHGSSGGTVSAIALYCMEQEGMQGAIHTGANPTEPWRNATVFSRSRADLIKRAGSRYSPASPCDGLREAESEGGRWVFIGKPCDVVGTRMSEAVRPGLATTIGINLAFFCAGTPSTSGLLELMDRLHVEPDSVQGIRFRGRGWPGRFSVSVSKERSSPAELSYEDAWGFLQKYRPYRCHLCPDGTGEFADLSCGDPWYRPVLEGEPGRSLVIVRTERGRRILRAARQAGYLILEPAGMEELTASQVNLLNKRRAVWGRIAAMKCFGIPTPRLAGFSLLANWRKLPWKEKLRSTLGTSRRIVTRGYYRRGPEMERSGDSGTERRMKR